MLRWTETHCGELRTVGYIVTKLVSKCGNDITSLQYVHNLIHKDFFIGHQQNIIIQNTLINAYGSCKHTQKAFDVFSSIANKDAISLSSMMKVSIKSNQHKQALQLHKKYNTLHSEVTAMLAIKACININDYHTGKEIHQQLHSDITNTQLFNVLIDFYAHFNDIKSAKRIYHQMSHEAKDTATINAMMKGFMRNKQYRNALNLYNEVLTSAQNGIKLNDVIHSMAIKACGFLKDLETGNKIKNKIVLNDKKIKLKIALIDFYFKCGDIQSAKWIFDGITHKPKPIKCINAMIKGYVQINDNQKALQIYHAIDTDDEKDEVSHLFAIKACIECGDIVRGKDIHRNIGNNYDGIAIYNALIEFYGRFHDIAAALNIFDELANDKKLYSIGSMMKMYINHNENEHALDIYDRFKCNWNESETVPHVLAIKACCNTLDFKRGQQIHHNLTKHTIDHCIELQNALINFYGDFGGIHEAIRVFDSIEYDQKDTVSIGSIMKAYTNNNLSTDALKIYDEIYTSYKHIYCDDIIHTLALKACADIRDLHKGQEIHALLIRKGLNDNKLQLKNGLIKLYGDCMDLENAKNVFFSIAEHKRDTITINSMMNAYIDNNESESALQLYDEYANINDDDVSHMSAITACIKTEQYEKGKQICDKNIHLSAVSNIKLKTTLIEFYGHCLQIENALNIFNSIADHKKHIITITAMMEAYWNCNMYTKSIALFENIHAINPNLTAEVGCYVSALKSCTNGTVLHIGQQIHNEIRDTPAINDIGIQINLIKMYGKCGELTQCKQIFNDAIGCNNTAANIGIWNAMIHALGRNGATDEAIALYDELVNGNIAIADIKTFMHLIGSCSHSGDMLKAKEIWNNIENPQHKYNAKVISTLIDCLARKGALAEAQQLILSNDVNESTAWISLMSGCKKYKDKEMAENVYNAMSEKFGSDQHVMSPASVLMSSIYGLHNEYDKSEKIWNDRIANRWKKPEASSEIYIDGILHKFVAGIRYKAQGEEYKDVDAKLLQLKTRLEDECGYKVDESLVTRALKSNETNEFVLLRHSEKIALAFALLKTDKKDQIVINKNLRICQDCHDFIRCVSDLEKRKFIVSDTNRVHVFHNGKCSCNEYY